MGDAKQGTRHPGGDGTATPDAAAARKEQLRGLAAVDEVLREPGVERLLATYRRDLVVDAVRAVIDRLRREILAGGAAGGAGSAPAAAQGLTAADPMSQFLMMRGVTPTRYRALWEAGRAVRAGQAVGREEAMSALVLALETIW